MTKEEKLEKVLYSWINETEKFETAVCRLIDKEKSKRELIKVADKVKRKFRYLENTIKFY